MSPLCTVDLDMDQNIGQRYLPYLDFVAAWGIPVSQTHLVGIQDVFLS